MAKNKYFNYNDGSNYNDMKLYKKINQEYNQIKGIVAYYYPKEIVNKDEIFLDSTKKFDKFYEIPFVFDNFQTFEGSDLFSKFGLHMDRGLEFEVSIDEFDECTDGEVSNPQIGDLIYLKNLNDWFEITYVNSEKNILPFGEKFTYSLRAKKLDFEDEIVISSEDTEVAENITSITSKFDVAYETMEDDVEDYINSNSIINDFNNPFGEY